MVSRFVYEMALPGLRAISRKHGRTGDFRFNEHKGLVIHHEQQSVDAEEVEGTFLRDCVELLSRTQSAAPRLSEAAGL